MFSLHKFWLKVIIKHQYPLLHSSLPLYYILYITIHFLCSQEEIKYSIIVATLLQCMIMYEQLCGPLLPYPFWTPPQLTLLVYRNTYTVCFRAPQHTVEPHFTVVHCIKKRSGACFSALKGQCHEILIEAAFTEIFIKSTNFLTVILILWLQCHLSHSPEYV